MDLYPKFELGKSRYDLVNRKKKNGLIEVSIMYL